MKKTKLLIIRFSSIGDIVLTSPVIRCLKKQLGNKVEIHYLTKEKFGKILQANPYIDQLITMRKKLKEVMAFLKNQNYDHIIDLHNSLRSSLLKLKLNKPCHSFNKINLQKWLLVNYKINYLPNIHIVDRYMQTVSFLDVKYDGEGLDYFYNKNEDIKKSEFPENYRNGFISFVIGGNHNTKKLPVEKIISICDKIDYPLILLGGDEDTSDGDIIANSCSNNVLNSCGKYSLNKSASLVKQSKAIITHDTGLMHIAAAFNKPVVSVWGNTIPQFGMYPFYPFDYNNGLSKIIEVKNLKCRPCSKIGYKECPKKHFRCMKEINENEIIDFVRNYI